MSVTEDDRRQNVERTIIRSQLSKNDETMRTAVRRGRATRGENKVQVLSSEKVEKQKVLPSVKNQSAKEGILSLRLSNIKVLSPDKL
jgi:hypothetical protein